MVGARSAAMGFNRFADYRFDRLNPRTADRPLTAGLISKPAVLVLICCLRRWSSCLPPPCWGGFAWFWPCRCLLVLFCSTPTPSVSPRFPISTLGFAIGLAPVGAWIAVTGSLDPRIVLLALALSLTSPVSTSSTPVRTLILTAASGCARFRPVGGPAGPADSRRLHVITFPALFALYLVFDLRTIYLIILIFIGLLLVWEHKLVQPEDLQHVNLAFFHVNSAISILLLMAVLLDTLLTRLG